MIACMVPIPELVLFPAAAIAYYLGRVLKLVRYLLTSWEFTANYARAALATSFEHANNEEWP